MTEQQPPQQPTEEELRAAYEQQLKQIKVDDVLVQTVLSLINLGSLRAGVVPGNEGEADPEQLRQAIEGVRALLPLVEPALGPDARQIRDAVSRLLVFYFRLRRTGRDHHRHHEGDDRDAVATRAGVTVFGVRHQFTPSSWRTGSR
mgnify:CR=1 FL=1